MELSQGTMKPPMLETTADVYKALRTIGDFIGEGGRYVVDAKNAMVSNSGMVDAAATLMELAEDKNAVRELRNRKPEAPAKAAPEKPEPKNPMERLMGLRS